MSMGNPQKALLGWWDRLSGLPGGKALFSRICGWTVPYTGTIGARVESLAPGSVRVALRDRRKVRNHLRSVHAIALCNLAEFSTGLALLTSLPDDRRGILTGIEMRYLKKARGRLVAECDVRPPEADGDVEVEVPGRVVDAAGDTVAEVRARWKVGPVRRSAGATA